MLLAWTENACVRLRDPVKDLVSFAVTQKRVSCLHGNNIWLCCSFGAANMGIAPSTIERYQIARCGRRVPPSLVGVSRRALPLVCLAVPGLSASNSGWCSGTTPMNLSARTCAEPGGSASNNFATGTPAG